jgi:hypothetical protein
VIAIDNSPYEPGFPRPADGGHGVADVLFPDASVVSCPSFPGGLRRKFDFVVNPEDRRGQVMDAMPAGTGSPEEAATVGVVDQFEVGARY